MSSVLFAVVEDLQTRGEWYEAGRLLAQQAAALERAGAEASGPSLNQVRA
jgi:aspartate/glutamate racemase